MITALAFVVVAGGGALARAEAGRRWNRHDGFPVGTLVVNVTGAFLLGLSSGIGHPAMTVVGVAGLGAYTTFSSFARDAVALVERRRFMLAAAYVAGTYLLGIAGAFVGAAL